ncbi:MAG: hypothetical protein ACKO9B_11190 [Planctomycetota bacterium]
MIGRRLRSLAATIGKPTLTTHAKATRRRDRRLSLFAETLERRQTPTASPLASLYADPDPQAGSGFGTDVVLLPNGNVVVSAPFQDITGPNTVFHDDAGAVYLFDGRTGNVLATLIGTSPGDRVGSGGITLLANGSYVVASPHWDNLNGTIEDAGAVTWRPGSVPASQSPVIEKVSTLNSLHGTSHFDLVGISSDYDWARNFSSADDESPSWPPVQLEFTDFDGVTPLPNGDYVVSAPFWDSGRAGDTGAVTWLRGLNGFPSSGGSAGAAVSVRSSIHGTHESDRVGSGFAEVGGVRSKGITVLEDGAALPASGVRNIVISSPYWSLKLGAVTWVSGATTTTSGSTTSGADVSFANSLTGLGSSDFVGSGGVTALPNGNYVVNSPDWGIIHWAEERGAVTWVQGYDGMVYRDPEPNGRASLVPDGVGTSVDHLNSLVGSFSGDHVGSGGIFLLANGHYVVSSPLWGGSSGGSGQTESPNIGAATWGNGGTGTSPGGVRGFISGDRTSGNSLIGNHTSTHAATYIVPLSNGGYVVGSPSWSPIDSGGGTLAGKVGAVTFCDPYGYVMNNGGSRFRGAVITGAGGAAPFKEWNSLVGVTGTGGLPTFPGDSVGSGGVYEIRTDHEIFYAVSSPWWTFTANPPRFSSSQTPVRNLMAGAVTLVDGKGFVVASDGSRRPGDTVRVGNSLHGRTALDQVGSGGVTDLGKGRFVVASPSWNAPRGTQVMPAVGAATWHHLGSPLAGPVSETNSLVGSTPLDQVGSGGVVALATGHYAVVSPAWDHNGVVDVGAVTWGSGLTGAVGRVVGGTGRTLHGSTADDRVGSGRSLGDLEFRLGRGGVTPLSDGSYVVASPHWSSPDIVGSSGERIVNDAGAVTRIGADGLIAPWAASAHTQVSTRNSLVGTLKDDRVGSGGVTALAKGHYLVTSPEWGFVFVNGTTKERGAITWVAGGAARGAKVTPANSRFGQVTEPGIILDNRNGRFLVGLREATPNGGSNNRVVAGWQTKGFVDVQASTEAAMAGSDTRRSSPSAAAAVPVVAREAAFAALGSLGTEAGAGSTAATTGGPTAKPARSVVLRR